MSVLDGKVIGLGVTGGIAAYRAAAVASLLVQSGARVEVIMTEAARRFIQPLTFSAITHNPVHTDPFSPWNEGFAGHVSLAARLDVLVVAPATASSVAKLALGLSDDLLGLVALATAAPMLIAPAMEDHMFRHPATQEHLATLARRGARTIGPDRGRLASGEIGEGRMARPEAIVDVARNMLDQSRPLRGRKIVVTAGGTREPLDPVRYIGNRSSGRMGYALAKAAVAAGADVTLVSGSTAVELPGGVAVINVETAAEMQRAVEQATIDADVLIMAAAVADFRPETPFVGKIKKETGQPHLDLRLVRNPDILAGIDRPTLVKIGFAAETENLVENASRKLAAKRLDMIVANDAEATIGAADSAATILTSDGTVTALPLMTKDALAIKIVRTAAELLERSRRHES